MDINFIGHPNIEFEAYCTGDGESFCWEVDKETYIRIKGWDEFSPYACIKCVFDDNGNPVAKSDTFRIYPSDIFGFSNTEIKRKIKISWE